MKKRSLEGSPPKPSRRQTPEQPPVAIEHDRFLTSVRSPEARSLVAAARLLLRSPQFPPSDPGEL